MAENFLNVVMVGASRSGKTSILASMFEQVKCSDIGNYFYIGDKSEYAYAKGDKRGREVSLRDNVDAMKDLLNSPSKSGETQPKLAELTGTSTLFTYDLIVRAKNDQNKLDKEELHVKFTDVPGEAFAKGGSELREIEKIIKSSQILLVAVDVPALMYAKEKKKFALNTCMNLPDKVLDSVETLGQDFDDGDLNRMVAFIPIKCEKWMHEKRMPDVFNEIEVVYKTSLKKLAKYRNVQVMIMPMETIGGLEYDHSSKEDNSYLLIYGKPREERKDIFIEEDYIGDNGAVRCEKISDDEVMIKNGARYKLCPSDELILAKERGSYPYVYKDSGVPVAIPFFWFIPTGDGYQPRYCEQALFQVLIFVIESIEKQKRKYPQNTQKEENNKKENKNPVKGFLNIIGSIGLIAVGVLAYLVGSIFGAFKSEEQCSKFKENIEQMKEKGIINDKHIKYLIKKENGKDLLN